MSIYTDTEMPMDAGRLCPEPECCDYGDANQQEVECCECDKTIIPAEEHELDDNGYYERYYGSDNDDGDICYECLEKIVKRGELLDTDYSDDSD